MTIDPNKMASITVHLPVRLDEIDYLSIVHASNYLKYMEHARIKLLEQQGVNLLALLKKGIRFVVAEDVINYLHPARYGDVLAIACRLEDLGESTGRIEYSISEQKTGKEILQATTHAVAIDANGKPTLIPPEVREALSRSV